MRFRTLEELVVLRQLEPKPPDPARVRRWLDRSRRDLALVADILADRDRDRAMAVAYEAGYRACAALLLLAGYRALPSAVLGRASGGPVLGGVADRPSPYRFRSRSASPALCVRSIRCSRPFAASG